MKIVSIIPVRGGSKSIPGKNIVDFAGKPLMLWTIEQAKASALVSEIYVTSDSKEILEIAASAGARTIIRPPELSTDIATSESALLHVLNNIKETPEYIVFLQVTAPLRKSNDIDNSISHLIDGAADSLLSVTKAYDYIWKESEGGISSLNFDYLQRKRRQDLQPLYYENGSIYVFKPDILEKYGNRLGGKISVYYMEPWQMVDINDNADLEWAEWLFIKHLKNKTH
jgi:N-acylneuraminate cytidylyltransferase